MKNTKSTKKTKPRIVIVPHYIGTETVNEVIKNVITDEIKKKIKKTA